ncbi:hypothetical protein DFH27DRAFT_489053 [Peziza echinospora]|nr:hypothetical protein DFH27DRAFT_489053 [Peziza echinospora]
MPFTPVSTAAGAILLHLSTTNLFLSNGRIFGVSSILGNAVYSPPSKTNIPVLVGMAAGSLVAFIVAPGLFGYLKPLDLGANDIPGLGQWSAAVAGGLVGFGTYFAAGCTSGHMLCGIPRLSLRSFVSTAIFFTTAVATATFLPSPSALPVSCPDGKFLSCFATTLPPPSTLLGYLGVVSVGIIGNNVISRLKATDTNRILSSVWSGALFAAGLAISGMADPTKVLGFLHISEAFTGWKRFDPSLLLVMLCGVLPNFLRWQHAKNVRTSKTGDVTCTWSPALDTIWHLPIKTHIDMGLVFGSVIFGMGWGMMGICPGPGVVSAVVSVFSGVGVKRALGYVGGCIAARGVAKFL